MVARGHFTFWCERGTLSPKIFAVFQVSMTSRAASFFQQVEKSMVLSCVDDQDSKRLFSVEKAQERILDCVQLASKTRTIPLSKAHNEVLAEDIFSPRDIPMHTNSAMDGYAMRYEDVKHLTHYPSSASLKLVGEALAGHPYMGQVLPRECVHITTGAVVPEGLDCVLMQEHAVSRGGYIGLTRACREGQNIRLAGEDMKRGEKVLSQGTRLTPAAISVVANMGKSEVSVFERSKVAIFSTGDEIIGPDKTLQPGQVFDSNRLGLLALLEHHNIIAVDLGHAQDTRSSVLEKIGNAAYSCDAIISSGGASVGKADFIREIVKEIGEVYFWKVAMKPGRPMLFGKIGKAFFFGLPGNPVSIFTTFCFFVLPALYKMSGIVRQPPYLFVAATAKSDFRKRKGRAEFQRGIFSYNTASMTLEVRTTGEQGSGILRSMIEANCFVCLGEECESLQTGKRVTIIPFAGLV